MDININEMTKVKGFESKNQVKSNFDELNNIKNKSLSQKSEKENVIEGNKSISI